MPIKSRSPSSSLKGMEDLFHTLPPIWKRTENYAVQGKHKMYEKDTMRFKIDLDRVKRVRTQILAPPHRLLEPDTFSCEKGGIFRLRMLIENQSCTALI